MFVMDAEWLSVPDVARRLNKDARTVRRTIRRGELAAHQLDERTLSVSAAELEAFIAKRRVYSGDAVSQAAGSNEDELAKAG
jgi:excisionase family DNA binding protein